MATRSRKGYWRMSANSIVQRALTNRWLQNKACLTCARYGLFFNTGRKPVSDRNRPVRTRMPRWCGTRVDLLSQSPGNR
jgi:hypothetical protein